MKIGINLWVWQSPFRTDRDLGLVEKAKKLRAEVVEFAIEDGGFVDGKVLRRALADNDLECSIIGLYGSGRDLASADATQRQAGVEYSRRSLELAAEAGATVLSGACVGVGGRDVVSENERITRYKRAAEHLHEVGEFAAQVGVRFCIEILNRYEDNILNTAAQACRLMDLTNHPSVGIHLDGFHMTLEESSMGAALRQAGNRLFHFHASDTQRGMPGSGHQRWPEIAAALKAINYNGFAVIESFNPRGRLAAHAACWRPYAESQDILAEQGLQFLWDNLR